MQLVLEIDSGPMASRRVALPYGEAVRVGREQGDLVLPHDARMSATHFSVEWSDRGCFALDLSLTGLFVNDERVNACELRDGDSLRAGGTMFTLLALHGDEPRGRTRRRIDAPPQVLSWLRGLPGPLFAVLDTARDVRVLDLLRTRPCEHVSLFDGEEAERLADVAPYLVSVPPDSEILERLAVEGWGSAWGVYLTSDRPLGAVRRALRRLLVVEIEDGKRVLFRFYDPRVLRVFMTACNARQASEMFEDVGAYLMEGEEAETALRFAAAGAGVAREAVALGGGEPQPEQPARTSRA